MKTKIYISLILIAISFNSCKRTNCHNGVQDGDETGIDCGGSCLECPPSVTTLPASAILATTATVSMQYSGNANTSVNTVGVCFGTSHNPTTIALANYGQFNSTGDFTGQLTSLTPSTTYYIRGFIKNNLGTAYGNEITFTTTLGISVTTNSITSITATTATSGGIVSSAGSITITGKGICYGTSANPTTSSSTVASGTGTGSFISNMTGLNASTTYFVRAYATYVSGTVYGNEQTFICGATTLPTLTTTSATSITSSSAFSGGNISSDGGASVSARGVCWNTTGSPTTSSTLTYSGTGTGNFSSNLTGLTVGTTYYIRAFATNSIGTAYGNEVSFTTSLVIGQSYQGGIIFYIDGSGLHGLIAAPSDQSAGSMWYNGSYLTTGAIDSIIGTGLANTNSIVTVQGSGSYAAILCNNLSLSGYNDWYLPSKAELNQLFINRSLVGGFVLNYYWSSTEGALNLAWVQSFWAGDKHNLNKNTSCHVRAIRSF